MIKTARQSLLAELITSRGESEIRHLLEKLPAAAYTCDRQGLIRYFNRLAVELWGRKPKLNDPVDRFCGSFRLFTPDGVPIRHDECWMARTLRENREYYGHEIVIERADGSRLTVLAHATPFRDDRGQLLGAVNILVDITNLRRAEHQAREAQEAAEAASRARDQFLAALSHELRTPLTPVLLGIADLEGMEGLPQEARQGLRAIRRNVEMEARLIDDLLDVTRTAPGTVELKSEGVDAHGLIRHAIKLCHNEIEAKRLGLTLDLRAQRHCLRGDGARLLQVVWNLVKNAAKFTPPGGSLSVATEDAGDDRLVIRVSDTGIGIDPDTLPGIFDAFGQGGRETTRPSGGLGLGLAITRALVEAHGGTIAAHSEGQGRGATFTLEFVGATAPSPGPGDPRGAKDGPCWRVLLAEDNEEISGLLSRILSRLCHDVTVAESIAKAVEAATAKPFDLLICDQDLPDGSGLELRRRLPSIPGIVLTGYGTPSDIAKWREAGFSGHLTKPIDLDKLTAMIGRVAG